MVDLEGKRVPPFCSTLKIPKLGDNVKEWTGNTLRDLLRRLDDRTGWRELTDAALHSFAPLRLRMERQLRDKQNGIKNPVTT